MLTILHGEHHVKSRTALTEQMESARQKGLEIVRLNAKQLEPQLLKNAFNTQSLFGDQPHFFIEGIFSLPKSKKRDELIQIIADAAKESPITLWEKKLLSATDLKAFPGAKATLFPVAKTMFTWLGALSGEKSQTTKARMLQLMKQTIDADGEFFAFAMLTRQVRMLMEAKEDPSTQPRVASQAKSFSWAQLFQLHHSLILLDQKNKTSSTALSFHSQLELLLISL